MKQFLRESTFHDHLRSQLLEAPHELPLTTVMRVALFTSFSPDIGGGAVQLKSILPQLSGLDIEWYYLAPSQAHSYQGRWLGPALSPTTLVSDLCARTGFLPGSDAAVKNLVGKMDADTYWVVAHNEGVAVADELSAAGKKVHLTVHDDPIGTFARSRKYFAFQPLMSLVFSRVLKAVASVDVTSAAMRDSFKQRHHVDSFALFRYLPALPKVNFAPANGTLRVGHIGTLYHPKPFRCFVQACRSYAFRVNKRLRILRIGASGHVDKIATENPDLFEDAGERSEEEAVSLLSNCDFVYAMYPTGRRFRLFRQTSFQVKVSTYIQAQRPIFAHTPGDSSLASFISRFGTGEVCSSNRSTEIERTIAELMRRRLSAVEFEAVRADLWGPSQVKEIRAALAR